MVFIVASTYIYSLFMLSINSAIFIRFFLIRKEALNNIVRDFPTFRKIHTILPIVILLSISLATKEEVLNKATLGIFLIFFAISCAYLVRIKID